ncbi:hypothetical protein [Streptobacillus ratti]|uniref:hypothetical protein n=1 Tax=Streptobacillus ratti TaxID=1720557 RepID=UPI0009338A77|nr:hypothetical protein [Streptobacillus ratti]
MNSLIAFIVEGKCDKEYIDKYISHHYKHIKNSSKIQLKYVVSNGKGNLLKEAYEYRKDTVIVVFDVDSKNDINDRSKTEKIKKECKSKGYKYIFFYKTIEDVFIDKVVCKSDKK